eukprot:g1109.t1
MDLESASSNSASLGMRSPAARVREEPAAGAGGGAQSIDESALAMLARASRLLAPSPKPVAHEYVRAHNNRAAGIADACMATSPAPGTPKALNDMREVRSIWKEERLRGDMLKL